MQRNERVYIPPPGAKRGMSGDRWVIVWLVAIVLALGTIYLVLRAIHR